MSINRICNKYYTRFLQGRKVYEKLLKEKPLGMNRAFHAPRILPITTIIHHKFIQPATICSTSFPHLPRTLPRFKTYRHSCYYLLCCNRALYRHLGENITPYPVKTSSKVFYSRKPAHLSCLQSLVEWTHLSLWST